jgi:hypothetical protein
VIDDHIKSPVVMPQWRKIVGAIVVYSGIAIGLALGVTWFYLFFYVDTSGMGEANKMSFLIQIGLPIIIAGGVSKLFFWIGKLINPAMDRNFPFNAPKKTKGHLEQ